MIDVKRCNLEDASLIADYASRLLKELRGKHVPLEHLISSIRRWMTQEKYNAFFAVSEQQIVGLITVAEHYALFAEGNFGVIQELYISPEHRSAGIGVKLLNAVKQLSVEKQWHIIELSTPDRIKWERTYDFYTREGFYEVGARLRYKPS